MKLREDPSAVGQVIAFLMASGILMASVGAVLLATEGVGSEARTQSGSQAVLEADAQNLLKVLLGSPGYTEGGTINWNETTADLVTRLGLRTANNQSLDFDKLRNLRLAPFQAADDGYVNYEEALAALGLQEKGLDFHIRAKPALRTVEELLATGVKDNNLRVTYIGNALGNGNGQGQGHGGGSSEEPAPGEFQGIDLQLDNPRCGPSPLDSGNRLIRFSVDGVNTGFDATQFQAFFTVTVGSKSITRSDQTSLVGAGQQVTFHVDIEKRDGIICGGTTTLTAVILDPSATITTQTFPALAVTDVPGTMPNAFYAEAGSIHYDATQTIRIHYGGDLKNNDPIQYTITGTAGAPLTDSISAKSSQNHRHFDIGPLAADLYQVKLTHLPSDSASVATQQLLVVPAGTIVNDYQATESAPDSEPPSTGGSQYSGAAVDESVAIEVAYLERLVEKFCPTYYDSDSVSPHAEWGNGTLTWGQRCNHKDGHSQPGDVFLDWKKVLTDDIPSRISYPNGDPRYDITNTIVVGSNVGHAAMTSGPFKDPLTAWVHGGGTLIVFGSQTPTTQWMVPMFEIGGKSSNGPLNTPDLGHGLLTVSDQLAYDSYDNKNKTWRYTGGPEVKNMFMEVVKSGDDPITAISNPGAIGKGTLIISTWLPYDLYGDGAGTSNQEGLRLMNNFLMQGYRDLFLDYGPPLPQGFAVVPALGFAEVWHPELEMMVTLEVTLFVFPNVRG